MIIKMNMVPIDRCRCQQVRRIFDNKKNAAAHRRRRSLHRNRTKKISLFFAAKKTFASVCSQKKVNLLQMPFRSAVKKL